MQTKDIPFRSIPRQSELFLKYVELSPSSLRFYRRPPTIESLLQAARGEFSHLEFPRREMASVLRRQNEDFGNDSVSLQNIGELENPDCFAILTGQQAGLFTGPLYTLYKAFTAIHIAEELKHRGVRAVPVFWMDSEDHDLAEVTHCTAMDLDSSIRNIDYRKSLFEGILPSNCPVGSLRFSERIRQVTADYARYLTDSVWKPNVCSQLEAAYAPGATFSQAFAQLISRILKGSGLILFDPHDAEPKQIASALFHRTIREADNIHEALVGRNRELEAAGFHTQVNVRENSSVLFFYADGERCALERHSPGFELKHGERAFSLEELLRYAEQSPERFSPNVLLRPVVQDYLFPTLAYVGGPSEIAYFAQAEALYAELDRPMPVIWPRNSYTLMESEVGTAMDYLRVDMEDCFQGRQHFTDKAYRRLGLSKSVVSLNKLEEHLDQVLTEVRPEIETVDSSLAQALDTARRKIIYNVQKLRSRLIRMDAKQESANPGTIDLLMNHCFPNGNLQERELSIHHFLSRLGPSLMDTIHSCTEIGNFAHRIIRL